jgi:hypothetical protein
MKCAAHAYGDKMYNQRICYFKYTEMWLEVKSLVGSGELGSAHRRMNEDSDRLRSLNE